MLRLSLRALFAQLALRNTAAYAEASACFLAACALKSSRRTFANAQLRRSKASAAAR